MVKTTFKILQCEHHKIFNVCLAIFSTSWMERLTKNQDRGNRKVINDNGYDGQLSWNSIMCFH